MKRDKAKTKDEVKESVEFISNALALRYGLTMFLLQDFHVKTKPTKPITLAYLSQDQKEFLEDLIMRYNMNQEEIDKINEIIINESINIKHINKYPEWLITVFRTNILDDTNKIVDSCYAINTIYVKDEFTYQQRYLLISSVIGRCYHLSQYFDYIRRVLSVDLNRYLPYLERIEAEIALLKGLRKYDARTINKIRLNR